MNVAMSKKAPAAPAKTKKSSARKPRSNASGVKKKTVRKKAVTKKSATREKAAKKVAKKAASSKKSVPTSRKENPTPKQAHATSGQKTPEESRSLSWMSAQAASALEAVTAIQARKGKAIIAKSRKQATEQHLDDDRLIELAAAMSVENEGLIAASTEQPHEEHPLQTDTTFPATEAIMDAASGNTDTPSDKEKVPESITELAVEGIEISALPAEPEPTLPPPQLAKETVAFQPAPTAGILFAALLLGFYFWPGGNDTIRIGTKAINNSAAVAVPERTLPGVPAATTYEPDHVVPWTATVDDVATAPVTEPDQTRAKNHNEQASSGITPARPPSSRPQTTAISPVPATALAPVEPQPEVAQPAQPPAPWTAPARGNYRAPVYGYYPQQQRPVYPQYYYR